MAIFQSKKVDATLSVGDQYGTLYCTGRVSFSSNVLSASAVIRAIVMDLKGISGGTTFWRTEFGVDAEIHTDANGNPTIVRANGMMRYIGSQDNTHILDDLGYNTKFVMDIVAVCEGGV